MCYIAVEKNLSTDSISHRKVLMTIKQMICNLVLKNSWPLKDIIKYELICDITRTEEVVNA